MPESNIQVFLDNSLNRKFLFDILFNFFVDKDERCFQFGIINKTKERQLKKNSKQNIFITLTQVFDLVHFRKKKNNQKKKKKKKSFYNCGNIILMSNSSTALCIILSEISGFVNLTLNSCDSLNFFWKSSQNITTTDSSSISNMYP